MQTQKIGISLSREYPVPMADAIKHIADCGFDAVSPTWHHRQELQTAKSCGLSLQSLHAPFGKVSSLWFENEFTAGLEETLRKNLDLCAEYEIPILVMHTWIGFDYTFDRASLDYSRFERLVRLAETRGVKIAFENTEGEEYLAALMDHFSGSSTVGFCWDSGHELCYNRSRDMLKLYGDRLYMTHLNDNLGISDPGGTIGSVDDLHLLPYDGIADWGSCCTRLKKARKQEFLNLELLRVSKPGRHENDKYEQMPLPQYLAEAYARACRIAALCAKD